MEDDLNKQHNLNACTTLVNTYYKRKLDRLDELREEKITELIEKDLYYTSYKSMCNKVNELRQQHGLEKLIFTDYPLSDDTKCKCQKLNDDASENSQQFLDEMDIVKCMIRDCETYEQRQEVLKSYGIINEYGIFVRS